MTHKLQASRAVAVAAAVMLATVAALAIGARASAAPDGPTCSDTLGIDHHGQHIIGDYVIGADGTGPGGGEGVEIRGGPGPGFHFVAEPILGSDVSPGASFCVDSNAPTDPPGHPFEPES